MNAETIQKLAWYMPASSDVLDIPEDFLAVPAGDIDLRNASHYLACYRDLSFGWKFAYRMARAGLDLPAMFEGEDLWVYRAYLYISGVSDDALIGDALSLTLRGAKTTCDKLRAMLLSRDATVEEAAKHMSMDVRVVSAYEKLFFNVVDRKKEGRFLAEVVYPNGRYVEMMKDYLQNEALGNILMRTGFNNGIDDVLYMAGMPDRTLEELFPSADSADRFEQYIMMNGYALGRSGFLNQSGMHGIQHARQVLQAIKQGGVSQGEENPLRSAGSVLQAELVEAKSAEAMLQIEYRRGRRNILEE